MSDVVLPDARFGMSMTRFNIGHLPEGMPERDALEAANRFNETRYRKLTVKQRVFVDAYLEHGFNATVAATCAGFPPNESEQAGKAMMRKAAIKQAIQYALEYNACRGRLKIDDVVKEIAKIAFASMGDLWVNDGNGDPHLKMPEDGSPVLDTIREIQVDSYMEGRGEAAREIKKVVIKQYDKLAALDKLMKYLAPAIEREAQVQANITNNVTQNNVTQNNPVTKIQIVPVPEGHYLPAPQQYVDDAPAIEGLEFTEIRSDE